MTAAHGLRTRPDRFRPLVLLVFIAVALFGVARTTGSGWLVVVVSGVAGLVPFALFWPALELRRAKVVVESPPDAVAGRPVSVRLTASGHRHSLQVRLLDPSSTWRTVPPGASGVVDVVPPRRGVVLAMNFEIRSGAPLGLVWWRSRRTATLPRQLEVAPRPVPASVPLTLPAGATGEGRTRGRTGADSVRSLRGYQVGDPIRLVHWAATARTGELMVKELEGPDTPRLVVAVDLSGDDEERVEHAASVAAGLVASARRIGVPTILATRESSGPVVAATVTPVDAGRRLARAVPGPPATGPWPPGSTVLRVTASGVAEERV